jgi:hypothetical protein
MEHESHPPQDKPKPPPLPPEALAERYEEEADPEGKRYADEAEQQRLAEEHEQARQALEAARAARIEAEAERRVEDREKADRIMEGINARPDAAEKSFADKWDETSDKLDDLATDITKSMLKTAGKGVKPLGKAFLFAGVTVGWVAKHPLGLAARTAEWGLRKLEDFFIKLGTPKFVVEGTQKLISWVHKKTGIKEEEEKKAAHGGGHDDHAGGGHGGGHAAKGGHGGGHGGGAHGGGAHGHGGGSHGKKKGGGGGHH